MKLKKLWEKELKKIELKILIIEMESKMELENNSIEINNKIERGN